MYKEQWAQAHAALGNLSKHGHVWFKSDLHALSGTGYTCRVKAHLWFISLSFLGYLWVLVSFSTACSVRVSLLLYLILPSWFLALDRGWSAMKSSPIATRLVYIYRTHRGSVKRKKSHMCSYTHSDTTGHSPHTFRNNEDRKQETSSRRRDNALQNYQVSSAGQHVLMAQNRTAAIDAQLQLPSHLNKHFTSLWKKAKCVTQGKIGKFLPLLFFVTFQTILSK